jgi:hypothetical protein
MPIVRRKLDANTVYPANLRYDEDTDTVQSNVNGDWVENPAADPRTQTTLPARITSNPACDAAQSVVDALHGQIDGVVEAIDNAATLFAIAGIILSIFTFGAYAIFVSLALGIGDQMVGFGSTVISAALTEPVYETLVCIMYCQFNSAGRLKAGGLAQAMSDVNAQIGGIGATIINAMLALAGEGGVNNLAALGTSTGDCDECGCGIECGAADQVTFGTVLEEYEEDGHRVLRVESVYIPSPGFWDVSIGNYGEAAETYPCCHIFAWVKYSGADITTTGYTTCPGSVVDPGNPETHDVSSAYWSSGIGGFPFVVNIVFGS